MSTTHPEIKNKKTCINYQIPSKTYSTEKHYKTRYFYHKQVRKVKLYFCNASNKYAVLTHLVIIQFYYDNFKKMKNNYVHNMENFLFALTNWALSKFENFSKCKTMKSKWS